MTPAPPVALALSGGGIRAMAFHLGVLKRMAELDLLERVARISTVSGSSLLMGLVYRSNDFCWPTSQRKRRPTDAAAQSIALSPWLHYL